MVAICHPDLLRHLRSLLLRRCQWVRQFSPRGDAPDGVFPERLSHGYIRAQGFVDRVPVHRVSDTNRLIVVAVALAETILQISGHIVGSPIGAVISDKYGRRWTMFCGCWIVILGMVIVVASKSLAAFAVGRFVLGLGITLSTLAAPAYAMEISPPHWRGRATGTWGRYCTSTVLYSYNSFHWDGADGYVGLYNCGWFGGSIRKSYVRFDTWNPLSRTRTATAV